VADLARPVKWRRIENMPRFQHFTPLGQGQRSEENILKLEELEAIRLKDLEGLEQEDCASRMEISRPTFQRILTAAREKVADSLIHGKGIRIEGGNYTRGICPVRCLSCGKVWEESIERLENKDGQISCPDCLSGELECCPEDMEAQSGRSHSCWGACRRLGRGPGNGRGFHHGRMVD
jgi:predicted DNA-binding protein (UPF0251 family)